MAMPNNHTSSHRWDLGLLYSGGTRPLLGMSMCVKWYCADIYNTNVYNTWCSISSIQDLTPHATILSKKILNTWDATPHIDYIYNVNKHTFCLCVESLSLWYQYFVGTCDFQPWFPWSLLHRPCGLPQCQWRRPGSLFTNMDINFNPSIDE